MSTLTRPIASAKLNRSVPSAPNQVEQALQRPSRSQRPPQSPSQKGKPAKFTGPKPPPKILFQTYFKSVGPRTYASQVKQAANGNHFLVLTEGKREAESDQVKKTSLYLYSEDFHAFFRMIKETAEFIKAHPLPDNIQKKRADYWAKHPAQPAVQSA